jgi:hypothetical protein
MNSWLQFVWVLIDILHCPACGKKAAKTLINLRDYDEAPEYQCDTPGCTFNKDGESAWTPGLIN